jgi:hypothetical protein
MKKQFAFQPYQQAKKEVSLQTNKKNSFSICERSAEGYECPVLSLQNLWRQGGDGHSVFSLVLWQKIFIFKTH